MSWRAGVGGRNARGVRRARQAEDDSRHVAPTWNRASWRPSNRGHVCAARLWGLGHSGRRRCHRPQPGNARVSIRQQATYGQLFWAVREWLVASAIGERLSVEQPFEERVAAAKLEIAARLSSGASLSVSGRVQRDMRTGRKSPSLAFQASSKPSINPLPPPGRAPVRPRRTTGTAVLPGDGGRARFRV